MVLGTTRVGKTRLAELFITQDFRRIRPAKAKAPAQQNLDREVVIVFDPKGDADLLKRMYIECKRAGRLDEFYVFHLGWPDYSAHYNAVGRFGRISEVATRIADRRQPAAPAGKAHHRAHRRTALTGLHGPQ